MIKPANKALRKIRRSEVYKTLSRTEAFKTLWRRPINKYIVDSNQREILIACESQRSVFLLPRNAREGGGSIEHYYHFIFDLLLPLTRLIELTPPSVVFMLADFGPLTIHLLELFPSRINIIEKSDLPNDVIKMPIIGMTPMAVDVPENELDTFIKNIKNCLKITNSDAKKILLIERLPPDEYYTSQANNNLGGSYRRSILNHEELKAKICSQVKHPFEFHNLQLEKVPFKEQIQFFSEAKIVFAQHGAALANCIWMNPNSVVVEFGSEKKRHFQIISKIRKQTYYRYQLEEEHSKIDVHDFLQWIRMHPQIESILNSRNTM